MIVYILKAYMAWDHSRILGVFESEQTCREEAKSQDHRKWDYIYWDKWNGKTQEESGFFVMDTVWREERRPVQV